MTFSFSGVNLYTCVVSHYVEYPLTVNLLGETKEKEKKRKASEGRSLPYVTCYASLFPSPVFIQPFLDTFHKPHQLEHILCNSLSVLPLGCFTQVQ